MPPTWPQGESSTQPQIPTAASTTWESTQNHHINQLELLSALLSIKALTTHLQNSRVHLRMDSTTAIAYIHNAGGRKLYLQRLAAKLLAHCIHHNIHIHITYLNAPNT